MMNVQFNTGMLGLIGWFWQADCVEIKEHVCCGRVFVIIQRGDLMDKAEFTNFIGSIIYI